MKHIVVIGGGFAGLWAAMGAAKGAEEASDNPNIAITLVNRDEWHAIRVRNYETNISDARLPLGPLLEQAGIELVIGEVTDIDTDQRVVNVSGVGDADEKSRTLGWDRLVLAAGSALVRPDIPGLAEFGFSIDTWDDADRLNTHLQELADTVAGSSVLIVGAGMTGVELACEMPARLRGLGIEQPRVILEKCVDMAMDGDPTALRLCVSRLIPIKRERTVSLDLPPLEGSQDSLKAIGSVLEAVGSGAITP